MSKCTPVSMLVTVLFLQSLILMPRFYIINVFHHYEQAYMQCTSTECVHVQCITFVHVHILDVCTGMDNLMEVTDYLNNLNKSHIYNLGLVLGLDYKRVVDLRENCGSNQDFLDAVVASWLQKDDRVKDVSWTALITALRSKRLGQNGIAERIAKEHGMGLL